MFHSNKFHVGNNTFPNLFGFQTAFSSHNRPFFHHVIYLPVHGRCIRYQFNKPVHHKQMAQEVQHREQNCNTTIALECSGLETSREYILTKV